MAGRRYDPMNTASNLGASKGGVALAVTSSTGVIGVGAGRKGAALACIEIEAERRHAEEIGPLIRQVLADAQLTMQDLDYLVVDIGPGRFTGLRVGLATMRALAFALDLPVVGLSSLEVIAMTVEAPIVTAVIDARRSEVFQQSFAAGEPAGEPLVGRPELLLPQARGVLAGDGIDCYWDAYAPAEGLDLRKEVTVSVETMLGLAADRVALPGTQVEPLYLRDPDVNPNVKVRPHA